MLHLKGSCHCGAVAFEVDTIAPVPFMRCYCSICRKTSGGGGYTVNILGQSSTLRITQGADVVKSYRAVKDKSAAVPVLCQDRFFCPTCASYLWARAEEWPEWIYPYASAIDSELPTPKATASIMLGSAAKWADPRELRKAEDEVFEEYPTYSLEQWHKERNALA
ncbi:hypothetical protein GGI21_000084 [Coemansia aciculifera]|uniref:Uncharacterized protein n=1 Tax=Coemansia aciculifera TaxID=417176 RepID=A0ACC1M637_9FUNG|nr:hypothetical protein IWW38_001766 [Coemansia aciculifera]KAJ2911170.1 hypothetical protein GGI21_000084 [Coemansia aciculifera]